MMRQLIALLWLVGFGSSLAGAEDVPLPRPRPSAPPVWVQPTSFREAAGPDFNSGDVTDKPSECAERIAKIAKIERMPRLIGPGACGGGDMVRVDAVFRAGDTERIAIKPAPYLRCPMAEQLAIWVREDAAPRAATLGTALQAVETYDDFECRGRNRQTNGKLSEHGKGNAVDVRGLTLADGRFFALTDIKASKEVRESLRASACSRFTTVLGPGSDSYHESHIHLDLIERRNGYRICQWDVREPPPPPQPVVASAPVNGEDVKEPSNAAAPAQPWGDPSGETPRGTATATLKEPVPLPLPRPRRAAAPSRARRL